MGVEEGHRVQKPARSALTTVAARRQGPRGEPQGGDARKYFFFEKKKQKTFAFLANAADTRGKYSN
jgi:hypothetical protein